MNRIIKISYLSSLDCFIILLQTYRGRCKGFDSRSIRKDDPRGVRISLLLFSRLRPKLKIRRIRNVKGNPNKSSILWKKCYTKSFHVFRNMRFGFDLIGRSVFEGDCLIFIILGILGGVSHN